MWFTLSSQYDLGTSLHRPKIWFLLHFLNVATQCSCEWSRMYLACCSWRVWRTARWRTAVTSCPSQRCRHNCTMRRPTVTALASPSRTHRTARRCSRASTCIRSASCSATSTHSSCYSVKPQTEPTKTTPCGLSVVRWVLKVVVFKKDNFATILKLYVRLGLEKIPPAVIHLNYNGNTVHVF